jgi:spoIIIJ-associated protein
VNEDAKEVDVVSTVEDDRTTDADLMTDDEEPLSVDEGAEAAGGTVTRLEEEGEIAADYLEELLDIADLDGDIDIDVDHGRASVAIVTEEGDARGLQRLVGKDGEVLDALQELTRLAVQARTGERSRLMLDIAGHRAERRGELERVAQRAIVEVQERGVAVSLDPMNAFERKVVHDAVAAAGLTSESSGVEPERFVVVRGA